MKALVFRSTAEQYLAPLRIIPPSGNQMAGQPNPSIPGENLANVDIKREDLENHRAVQTFPTTTEERVDPDSSSAFEATTRDLKDSNDNESIRPTFKKELAESARGFLVDSPDAALPPIALCSHESGSCVTHEHCTNTERMPHTTNTTYDPSRELLDGISAPPQRPIPIVTPEVQASSPHSVPEISTDPFPYEKVAKRSHDVHSTSTETESVHDHSTLKKNREPFSGVIILPQIIIDEATNDAISLGNHTKVKVENTSALQNESDKEQRLDTRDLRPGPNEHGVAISQAGLVLKSAVAEDATPMDCQILAQKLNIDINFTSVKPTCVAITLKRVRCTNPTSRPRWEEACAILDYLVSLSPYYDAKKYAEGLDRLACLVLCKHKHQDRATALVEAWKDSFSCSVQATKDLCLPTTNVLSHTSTAGLEDLSGASALLDLSMKYNLDFLRLNTRQETRTMIRGFVPYQARELDKVNTGASIEAAIKRDLLKSEMIKDGFIYIYWFPGNFGHLKIGHTGRAVEERLQEWKIQCGHDPILVYPISEGDRQRVPHVFRVEAIVQAELRKYRRKEVKCKGCHKAHIEWFEQSPSAAITSVRKWSAWIRKEPYETTGRLKDKFKQDLRILSKIVPDAQVRGGSPQSLKPEIRRSREMSGSRLRPHSEQPRRRSSRVADRNRRPSLVEGEKTSLSFSAEFLAAAPSRRTRSETGLDRN